MSFKALSAGFFNRIFPVASISKRLSAEIEAKRNDDIAEIEKTDWRGRPELALSEADRIATEAVDRRKSAEGKAATYLALVGALIPIIVSLQGALWEKKAGPAPFGLILSLLVATIIYLSAAATFLFRAIRVSTTYSVGVTDLTYLWRGKNDPFADLTTEKLKAARYEHDAINVKVGNIRAAQGHLYNASVVMALMLITNACWYLITPPTVSSGSIPSLENGNPVGVALPKVSNKALVDTHQAAPVETEGNKHPQGSSISPPNGSERSIKTARGRRHCTRSVAAPD